MDHMDLVNKFCNSQATPSEVLAIKIRSITELKAQRVQDCHEILSNLVHKLSHLEGLEQNVLDDGAEKAVAINHLTRSGFRQMTATSS